MLSGHRYIELFLNSSMDATASSGTPYSAAPRQGSWRNGTSRGQVRTCNSNSFFSNPNEGKVLSYKIFTQRWSCA